MTLSNRLGPRISMAQRKKMKKWLLFLLATMIAVFYLFPIYWMIISSFKSNTEIFSMTPSFLPRQWSFEGYKKMFGIKFVGQSLQRSIWNSLIISLLTCLISVFVAVFMSYGLVRFSYVSNKILLLIFLIAQMMPTVLFLSPLYMMFKEMGLIGTLLAPAIYVTLRAVPFSVLMLRPYFLNVPKDIEDAAVIDGCSKFSAFFHVMIPMVYPGILVVAVLSFLWGWGDMVGAMTFSNTAGNMPLSLNMYRAIADDTTDWSMLMAFATILVVPTIALFLALQKHIIKGLTSGAVKG